MFCPSKHNIAPYRGGSAGTGRICGGRDFPEVAKTQPDFSPRPESFADYPRRKHIHARQFLLHCCEVGPEELPSHVKSDSAIGPSNPAIYHGASKRLVIMANSSEHDKQ